MQHGRPGFESGFKPWAIPDIATESLELAVQGRVLLRSWPEFRLQHVVFNFEARGGSRSFNPYNAGCGVELQFYRDRYGVPEYRKRLSVDGGSPIQKAQAKNQFEEFTLLLKLRAQPEEIGIYVLDTAASPVML